MKRPEDYLNRPIKDESIGPISLAALVSSYFDFVEARQVWLAGPDEFRLKGNQDWYRYVYLNSYRWQIDVRPAMLEYAEYRCQSCGARNTVLDVHHITYDRLGFESAEDLEVLCRDCHEAEHGIIVENTAPSARPHMRK